MATKKRLEHVRGDTFDKTLTFSDDDGRIDITGWTVFFTVKEHKEDSDADAVISTEVSTHDDPTNGVTSITVSHTETDGLDGTYYYDFQVKTDTGDIATIMFGPILFTEDVTLRTS